MCSDKYIYGCTNCIVEVGSTEKGLEGADCVSVNCKGKLLPKRIDSCTNPEEVIRHSKYKCFSCGHSDFIQGKRKDYQELRLCPCCNGLYIDIWKIGKYKHLKPSHGKYLQIILDELDSVPKVIYKGKEVKLKQEVVFHWETGTDVHGGTTMEIEYAEPDNKYQKSKRIEERTKSHIRF